MEMQDLEVPKRAADEQEAETVETTPAPVIDTPAEDGAPVQAAAVADATEENSPAAVETAAPEPQVEGTAAGDATTPEAPAADAEPPSPPETVPAEEPATAPEAATEGIPVEELLGEQEPSPPGTVEDSTLKAVLEAIVYVAEEPLTTAQLAAALQQPAERIRTLLDQLIAEFDRPEHGVTIREVAGGFKMATKAEHHDAVRSFVKSLKPPLKLSLPALETLAVIAYKQPVTAPEIMEIRGVQGAGVLKTLLDRKLIAVAGRKNVIGKPILYKTTRDFMIQFGLKDLTELPSLKEFEEIRRMALSEPEPLPMEGDASEKPPAGETPEAVPATPAPDADPVPSADATPVTEASPSPEEN